MGIIYRIFNIDSDKSYIGKTKYDLYSRLKVHIRDRHKFPNRPLYAALNKYGIDNFSAEVLGYFDDSDLSSKEIFFIEKYNTYYNGYNATFGGEGKKTIEYTDTDIIDLYRVHGNIKSISKTINVSDKTISKILNTHRILITSPSNRKVRINYYNLEFESITACADFLLEAEITTNKYARNKIYDVLIGLRKDYLGLNFEYI